MCPACGAPGLLACSSTAPAGAAPGTAHGPVVASKPAVVASDAIKVPLNPAGALLLLHSGSHCSAACCLAVVCSGGHHCHHCIEAQQTDVRLQPSSAISAHQGHMSTRQSREWRQPLLLCLCSIRHLNHRHRDPQHTSVLHLSPLWPGRYLGRNLCSSRHSSMGSSWSSVPAL